MRKRIPVQVVLVVCSISILVALGTGWFMMNRELAPIPVTGKSNVAASSKAGVHNTGFVKNLSRTNGDTKQLNRNE